MNPDINFKLEKTENCGAQLLKVIFTYNGKEEYCLICINESDLKAHAYCNKYGSIEHLSLGSFESFFRSIENGLNGIADRLRKENKCTSM